MQDRYVVVKGRYGMGGRINVVLAALDYAEKTSRKLVVDWSDGFYGTHEDTFSEFFTNPFCRFTELQARARDALAAGSLTVLPQQWSNYVLEKGDQPVETKLYMAPPPEADVEADIVVVTWVSNTLSDGRLAELAQSLEPIGAVSSQLEKLSTEIDLPNAVGVHYRHGNGERGVICPDPAWFVEAISSADPEGRSAILFCTDSRAAEDHFREVYGDRLKVLEKQFPQTGPLHNNKEITDRSRNAIEALTDLYALAACRHLVDSGEFFGKTASQLGAGSIRSRTTYPGLTRLFNSQQDNLQGSDLLPLESQSVLQRAFADAGLKPDNLFVKQQDDMVQVFYGRDFVIQFRPEQNSGVWNYVREAVLRRRLYL